MSISCIRYGVNVIEITDIRTKKSKNYGYIEFLAEFKQWQEQPKRVFLNRLRESPCVVFELVTYKFSTTDYLKFKAYFNLPHKRGL